MDEKLPIKYNVVEAEVVGKLEDPDLAPGELTYDEGQHSVQVRLPGQLTSALRSDGRRDGSSSRCIHLYDAHVRFNALSFRCCHT